MCNLKMQTSLSYQQQNAHHHHHHHRQHEKHLYYLSNEPHDADHEADEATTADHLHSHERQEQEIHVHHRSDCENYRANEEFLYQDSIAAHNDDTHHQEQERHDDEQMQYACGWDQQQQHKNTYQDSTPVYHYPTHALATVDSEQQFGAAAAHVESAHHEHVGVELSSCYESRVNQAIDLSHHETSAPGHIYYDLSSANVDAQTTTTTGVQTVSAETREAAAHQERATYTNLNLNGAHHHDHYSQLYSYPGADIATAATVTNTMIEPPPAIQHEPSHQTFVVPTQHHHQHHHHSSCQQTHLDPTYNQITSPHHQYEAAPFDHTDYNNLANLYDNSKHEPEHDYQNHQDNHHHHRTTGGCYSVGEQSISHAYHPMHHQVAHLPPPQDSENSAVDTRACDAHQPAGDGAQPEQVCASSSCAASNTPTARSHSAALSSFGGSGRPSSSSSSSSPSSCELLDSDLESIDSQLTRDEKKAREANIPLSYHAIVNLSIEQFNEHIVRYPFSETQLTLMKDIRRRGKNKVAAQTCRKRKMEQISELQLEVAHLTNKRAALSCERSRLSREHARLSSEYERLYGAIQGHLAQAGGGGELNSTAGQQQQQQQQQQQVLVEQNSSNLLVNVS